MRASDVFLPPGVTFKVIKENEKVIDETVKYFNNDSTFAGNMYAGLLIRGNVGSGKTHLFKAFQLMATRPFIIVKCRQIERNAAEKGYEALKIFTTKTSQILGGDVIHPAYCFDDLGAEGNIKSFGNELNVMAEVIQDRYELWKDLGVKTHFTTNLSRSEITARYGDRCLSRLEEMCNFLNLGTGENSTDHRIKR